MLYIIGEDGAWGGSEIVGDRSDHMRARELCSSPPALQRLSCPGLLVHAKQPAANTQLASLDAATHAGSCEQAHTCARDAPCHCRSELIGRVVHALILGTVLSCSSML